MIPVRMIKSICQVNGCFTAPFREGFLQPDDSFGNRGLIGLCRQNTSQNEGGIHVPSFGRAAKKGYRLLASADLGKNSAEIDCGPNVTEIRQIIQELNGTLGVLVDANSLRVCFRKNPESRPLPCSTGFLRE